MIRRTLFTTLSLLVVKNTLGSSSFAPTSTFAPTSVPTPVPSPFPTPVPTEVIDTFTFGTDVEIKFTNDEGFTARQFLDIFCDNGLKEAYEAAFKEQLPPDIEAALAGEGVTASVEVTLNGEAIVLEDDCSTQEVEFLDDRRLQASSSPEVIIDDGRRLAEGTLNDTTFNYTVIFETEVEQEAACGTSTLSECISDVDINGTLLISDTKEELAAIGNDTNGDGADVLDDSTVTEIDSAITSIDPTSVPTTAPVVACTTDYDCDYGEFCDFTRRSRSLLFGAYYAAQGVCSDEY